MILNGAGEQSFVVDPGQRQSVLRAQNCGQDDSLSLNIFVSDLLQENPKQKKSLKHRGLL